MHACRAGQGRAGRGGAGRGGAGRGGAGWGGNGWVGGVGVMIVLAGVWAVPGEGGTKRAVLPGHHLSGSAPASPSLRHPSPSPLLRPPNCFLHLLPPAAQLATGAESKSSSSTALSSCIAGHRGREQGGPRDHLCRAVRRYNGHPRRARPGVESVYCGFQFRPCIGVQISELTSRS